MREVPFIDGGSQTVFEAPMPGIYRFTAIGPSGGTQFWIDTGSGTIQVEDLVNSSSLRMFVAFMQQGHVLKHGGSACELYGSREPDEVPPEE